MPRRLPPAAAVAAAVFVLVFLFQLISAWYFSQLASSSLADENQTLKTEIAASLGRQVGRALASGDDLAALTVFKTSRSLHPQLQEATAFDHSGKILYHTDPGMMGRRHPIPAGPRASAPERRTVRRNDKSFTQVLVPLAEGDWFFQALFGESRSRQRSQAAAVRMALLSLVSALAAALTAWMLLRGYEWVDPRQRAASAPQAEDPHRRVAGLLLAEMPHAALAVNRDNRVLAANPLALELLNCRPEELEGMHLLQSPLVPGLVTLYQQAIKTPARATEADLPVAHQGPALRVRIACSPASPEWELALVTLG